MSIIPVEGLPEFGRGDDLAAAITGAADLRAGDVVVVAQKVVSKIEGAVVDPPPATGDEDARRVLARTQAIAVVADSPQALIVRTRHGLVCANAGIDASNVPGGRLALLPADPDASAARLRAALSAAAGVDVAVVVTDTFGRPWRLGQTDVAIGLAGMAALRDERGSLDRQGVELAVTEVAIADELAAAADLVRTKAGGVPVVIVRGFAWDPAPNGRATDLVRDPAADLFTRGRGMLAATLAAPDWPESLARLDDDDLRRARVVAPDLAVVSDGPPAILTTADRVAGGLAAAVLVDGGALVQWRVEDDRVILEAGRRR